MNNLKINVDSLGIEDVPMTGIHYTWIQKRKDPDSGIMKKLDRIMGNGFFLEEFKACVGSFLPYNVSDHSPALLVINDAASKKPKTFRFMNFLAYKPEFLDIVKAEWGAHVNGSAMFVLAKRLKMIKSHMRILNKRNGNVSVNVKLLKTELEKVQKDLDKNPLCSVLREAEVLYCNAYKAALLDEEWLLRQKSKMEWLKEGDLNNAFFHSSLKGRLNKNRIESITDDDGIEYTGADVADKFVEHFQNVFGIEGDTYPVEDPFQLFSKKISVEDAADMIKPVTSDEIKLALFVKFITSDEVIATVIICEVYSFSPTSDRFCSQMNTEYV